MDEHYLIVLHPGDADHYLFRKFIDSLPEGALSEEETKNLANAYYEGFYGKLEDIVKLRFPDECKRHFMILTTPALDGGVNKQYFVQTPDAELLLLDDKPFYAVIHLEKPETDFLGVRYTLDGIKEAGDWFREKKSDKSLVLEAALQNDPTLESELFRKAWYGFTRKKESVPLRIRIGVETADRRYLLAVHEFGGLWKFKERVD